MFYIKHLRELALERKKIEFRLLSISDQLILHLFKIFYHGNTQEKIDHWSGDLYDLLYSIPTLSGSHKFPKEDLIYHNLWGYTEDRFATLTRGMITKLNRISKGEKEGFGIIKDLTPNSKCEEFCREYFLWISEQLSKYGEISEEEIREEISSLLKEIK